MADMHDGGQMPMTRPPTAQSEREFIDYRFTEVFKRLDRMEQTMNGFAFVKQSDFESFAKEVRDNYVRKESLKWLQNMVIGIGVGVGIPIIVALIKLVGDKL